MGLPSLAGVEALVHIHPVVRGLPIASFHCRVGFAPALCLAAALLDGTAKCPESLCPMSVARWVHNSTVATFPEAPLVPYHGGPTGCVYLFLPPCHRPSPREVWVGFPLLSANTTSRGGCFRGCRHFFMFRPPSLLVSQVVPTAAQSSAGQPR